MLVKQLYTNCLSEAAYFVASGKEAIVIDPMRDIDDYLSLAEEHNVAIKYIFETHFHADFISGHLELAEKTGATIVYGPHTQTSYPVYVAKDGETFKIGETTLEVLHTPGHTLESSCYLLKDEQENPSSLFTGDTLFVGDVGRPDLSSGHLGKEELAGHLYHSIQRLKQLPDDLIIYPAHGPGSACGKSMSKETSSTIGAQKALNYAMKKKDKESFIAAVTEGLSDPPSYFQNDAKMNQEGYHYLKDIMVESHQALTIGEFKRARQQAWVIDTRSAKIFSEGFIPQAINIGLQGRFAEWAGKILPFDQPILLVTEKGEEKESIIRLARIGFHHVIGYLDGGFQRWQNAGENIDLLINVPAEELQLDLPFDKNLKVWDVRESGEFEKGHVEKAFNVPLSNMMNPITLANIEEEHNLYVHCQSGYRSAIACSLIKRQGFHNLRNVVGGFKSIQEGKDISIVKEDELEESFADLN